MDRIELAANAIERYWRADLAVSRATMPTPAELRGTISGDGAMRLAETWMKATDERATAFRIAQETLMALDDADTAEANVRAKRSLDADGVPFVPLVANRPMITGDWSKLRTD